MPPVPWEYTGAATPSALTNPAAGGKAVDGEPLFNVEAAVRSQAVILNSAWTQRPLAFLSVKLEGRPKWSVGHVPMDTLSFSGEPGSCWPIRVQERPPVFRAS